MTVQWKAIIPPKLNNQKFKAEVEAELKRQAEATLKEFQKTTATWEHQVEFKTETDTNSGTLTVSTDDEIYGYVNDGTQPHAIVPVRANVLRFQAGYTAKTTPRVIGSTGGGASGPLVFTKRVQHPGTKAREFDKVIQKNRQIPFQLAMAKAFVSGVVKAGLGLFGL